MQLQQMHILSFPIMYHNMNILRLLYCSIKCALKEKIERFGQIYILV